LRRSLSIELCCSLFSLGSQIVAFDPAVKDLPEDLKPIIRLVGSTLEAAQGSDAIIVSTEWSDFREIKADELKNATPHPVVVDPGRFLETNLGHDPLVRYYSIGKGPLK
jgi:UDPglucose 6-dehydrogenase